MALMVSNGACAMRARMLRGSSPSHVFSCTRYADGRMSSTPFPTDRANISPRAMSGSMAGGSEATWRLPWASATRCTSSTAAGLSRDGSRSSGRETSARATWLGTSIRFAGSMRMPRREISPSSSRGGNARRMSVSLWLGSGFGAGDKAR